MNIDENTFDMLRCTWWNGVHHDSVRSIWHLMLWVLFYIISTLIGSNGSRGC